jgi:gamma-glutamyltranspeptidase/glutathione hydrolase
MATGAGFLLNNEMDDFATAPGRPNHYGLIQGEANAIRPFARPLSSMSPTIGLRGDTLAFVVGSPGGPHIISAVIQTIINLIDHEMDAQSAVDLPRVHHQWLPDTLFAEPGALVEDVRVALGAKGHAIVETAGLGSVQAIAARATPAGERILSGGSDSRRNGCAVGVQDGRWVARRAISIPNAAVRFD